MPKIVIIEDDPAIREELALLLANEGFQTAAITDFTDVPKQVSASSPDLILLDLGLPGRDGMSLCARIRKNSSTPIIFITSRDCASDELRALSLGGDDYITKPYNIPVLLARIKAVLRRSGALSGSGAEPDVLEAGGLTLRLTRGTACAGDACVELTRNELKILAFLMSHAGEIISRADLIDQLWDSQIYIDDNTLSVNITRLRGKLEEIGLPGFIKTRRGMGYQL
ncbi:MAG: response regulator transcription factor [Lachnospiraceae bacterium]|mgnify:FL=1|jgi:DNA-binding response OmpR family regulator|nr:response regulator transcription factor [Lachnospiraceae bacterium]